MQGPSRDEMFETRQGPGFVQLPPAEQVEGNPRGPRTVAKDGPNGEGCAPLELRKGSWPYLHGYESRTGNAQQ